MSFNGIDTTHIRPAGAQGASAGGVGPKGALFLDMLNVAGAVGMSAAKPNSIGAAAVNAAVTGINGMASPAYKGMSMPGAPAGYPGSAPIGGAPYTGGTAAGLNTQQVIADAGDQALNMLLLQQQMNQQSQQYMTLTNLEQRRASTVETAIRNIRS